MEITTTEIIVHNYHWLTGILISLSMRSYLQDLVPDEVNYNAPNMYQV